MVESLDAYRFYFQSSRFASFEEPIGSFSGEVTSIPAELSGPTANSLLSATASEIAGVMGPVADPEWRQRLFDRWVHDLALPLRSRMTGLELSRLVGPGGDTELLVLESPEPLPFSEDVALSLKKRTVRFSPDASRDTFLSTVPVDLVELVAGLEFADK